MGQIIPFAIGYAPKYTALASGQLLPVNQNQALFALLGTTFGGTGQPGGTFGLPNLGGRTAVGCTPGSSALPLGAMGGEANHTLTLAELPPHSHSLNATGQGSATQVPEGNLPGTVADTTPIYGNASALVPLSAVPMGVAGAGQPHSNMQPSLAINFAVVLRGIYPTRG